MKASLLFLLGAVLALIAGIVGFFAVAMVVPVVPVFAGAGALAAAGAAWLVGRRGVRALGRRRVWPFVAAVTVAVCALAWFVALRPHPVPPAAAVPAGVRFWDLPTGSRLAYVREAAKGTARPYPVIFLHGGPGTPGEGVPEGGRELAAAGFDVYAYDQLGAGRSTRLDDVGGYTVARHVADLDAVRTALGAERVILVGRSWGGTLTAAYMAAHPDRVDRAVLTSPGAIWEPAYPDGVGSPWGDGGEPDVSPRFLVQNILIGLNPAAAYNLVGDREADSTFRDLLVSAKDTTGCPGAAPAPVHDNQPGFYVNQLTSQDEVPDPRPKLREVKAPTLIVRGECDYIKQAVTDEYRSVLPNTSYTYVKGAGHSIANGRPDVYRKLLMDFLTRGDHS